MIRQSASKIQLRDTPSAPAHSLSVLETKLYKPKWRPGLVSRRRLIERIREGLAHPLTLVSAPAGFGKTTLLAEWLAMRPLSDSPAAWVSLDRSENEPALFWAYVVHALQKAHPGLGEHALSMLQSPLQPPTASVLTSLINEITAVDRDFILVLDDYHVIEAPAIHNGVSFLIDHLPARMRVVIASRSEPPLPLARLRVRGQVTELRSSDLRFRPDEAAAFLNQVMSLDLSATDVSTLETRTEGWIAGLKLAALSLQNHGDVQTFVHAFSGGNRYIGDYLIQEVLRAQSPGIREFLLDTAILDRLSGPLCDALTGERDSQARLESLERSNLFVVPLDDTRTCYRYHHLFAEVLRAHSLREDPDRVRTMHRRASAWFEERAAHAEALHHAAAANDPERVARLLELRWPALDKSYQTSRWLERVTALPDAMIRVRPVLSMGYAWALLNVGELELVADRLDDVEQWLRIADSGDSATDRAAQMIVVDESRWRILNVELASARVYLAQALGEVGGTAEHARRLLQLIPEGDHSARARASALLGLSLWSTGDLEDAYGAFTAALAHMRSAGGDFDAIRGTFVPADIRVAQGRLHEAEKIYSSGLRLAKDATLTAVPQTDELYLGLSELHRERNELEAAREVLRSITEARDRTDYAGNRLRWCTAMSRIAEARGDLDAALDLLVEAEGVDVRSPVPRVRPLPAIRARLWILQGKMVEAERWAKESGLSADDELSYLREFEHITLVRLLIARHRAHKREAALPDALALIERLLMAASRGGRKGSVIEVLVLEAVTLHARNDTRAALDPLERALALAEPEGYVRVFVDEGEPMRDLLRHAAARGTGGSYTRHVLAHFDGAAESGAPRPRLATTVPEPTGERLLQALTARELEILRLIAVGLRNQEIADQLSISTATVKRHVANAYAKLGVSHRTEALVRAHALNLL